MNDVIPFTCPENFHYPSNTTDDEKKDYLLNCMARKVSFILMWSYSASLLLTILLVLLIIKFNGKAFEDDDDGEIYYEENQQQQRIDEIKSNENNNHSNERDFSDKNY